MNSLYGKFGMSLDITRVNIYDCSTDEGKAEFKEMLDTTGETVEDYIQIENVFIIVRNILSEMRYNEEGDYYHGIDVNIAIAVTSYARVYMSAFKNNPAFILYYSDTDSIVIDSELPATIVGNKLGQLKLEHVIKRGVFLAPKVYGFITDEGDKIIKIKGVDRAIADSLTINDLENLLIKNNEREFNQEKWFRKNYTGEISIKDVAYTLKINSNKRKLIYIDNHFEDTKPFNYSEIIKV